MNNDQKLVNASKQLTQIEIIAGNTETSSIEALTSLRRQGEIIDNFDTTIININNNITESTNEINKIKQNAVKFKIILLGIIAFLVVLIVIIARAKY